MTSYSRHNIRRCRPLLGTFVEINVEGPDGSERDNAVDTAFAAVEEVQRRMSFHDPMSMLSRLNREAASQLVQADEWTFAVLQAAAQVHRVSGGVFDVTIAPRLQALRFLPCQDRPPRHGYPCNYSFNDVELTADHGVRFHHPDIRIDLGGIAKGFAADQAVAALRSAGVERGLVNAGGDLRAFGDVAFPIGIRHPADPSAMLTSFTIRDSAVATSAHYFADRLVCKSQVGPIIDPRGKVVADLPRSATVRAATAMIADALTKVVMLSAEDALPVLQSFGADALFVAADGWTECSDNWNAPLHFSS